MNRYSLSKAIIGSQWMETGIIANSDGSISKAFEMEPFSTGVMEAGLDGPLSEQFFAKLGDLLTKLPGAFDGQIIFRRKRIKNGFFTKIYAFEKMKKKEAFSHFSAVFNELKCAVNLLEKEGWTEILSGFFGASVSQEIIPDITWEKDCIQIGEMTTRALSLTELPQVTWKGCLQAIFEFTEEFTLSLKIQLPDRGKIKRQLETKRRISHAMSVASSLEIRNIESNSVLSSSEETLERILVEKESLFEISLGVILHGESKKTLEQARELERLVSGVGNAGFFLEGIGSLPVVNSHIPGNKTLGIRKLPILSSNLAHIFPVCLDYSRLNERSALPLQSRNGEVSHLNLFSKENLNFNAFICGASGAGKSFLMNAILSATKKDEPDARLCIFDIGGSYRKIVAASGGLSTALSTEEASSLIASFLQTYRVVQQGFFQNFIETLCGSGSHITHSHRVAIDELLREREGEFLLIRKLVESAARRPEKFFQEIAHWLKPHIRLDDLDCRQDLVNLIHSPVSAFDFKKLESSPVLQKTTILLLTEMLWRELSLGKSQRTIVVFDEVWKFFAQSKGFLEELYRTLRKYRAGIVSVTQNLADYGDEAFAKMIFSTSFTKIFLQNGANGDFLRNTLDVSESDISRALSVASYKPYYSEFFALTPNMSQVFRLYPTKEFYDLANTENINL